MGFPGGWVVQSWVGKICWRRIWQPTFKALLQATSSLKSFLLWRFPIGCVFCHLWTSLYISYEDLLWSRALVCFLVQSYALWSLSSMEDLLGWVPCRKYFSKHNAKIWNQTPGSALPHPHHSDLLEFLMKGAWGPLENEARDEWQGQAGGYSHTAAHQADHWGQGNGQSRISFNVIRANSVIRLQVGDKMGERKFAESKSYWWWWFSR